MYYVLFDFCLIESDESEDITLRENIEYEMEDRSDNDDMVTYESSSGVDVGGLLSY